VPALSAVMAQGCGGGVSSSLQAIASPANIKKYTKFFMIMFY
jgi:hypothetical protein